MNDIKLQEEHFKLASAEKASVGGGAPHQLPSAETQV